MNAACSDIGLTVDAASFKLSMRQLAGAVSVITVGRGSERTGFTATSVSSLSAESPSVIVSVNRSASAWAALEKYRCFCVNVLAHDQEQIARSFAGQNGRKGAERYGDAEWHELSTGTPALKNALTVLDCEMEHGIDHHSHAILIGHVRAITIRPAIAPLIYWQGGFRRLASSDTI